LVTSVNRLDVVVLVLVEMSQETVEVVVEVTPEGTDSTIHPARLIVAVNHVSPLLIKFFTRMTCSLLAVTD